jgi:hypothetical protein
MEVELASLDTARAEVEASLAPFGFTGGWKTNSGYFHELW